VIIAGLTAQGLARPFNLYLGYPDIGSLSASIFFAVALVAIPAGVAGAGMSKCMLTVVRLEGRVLNVSANTVFYIVGCALLIGRSGLFYRPQVLGFGEGV